MEILLVDNHTTYIGKLDTLLRSELDHNVLNLDLASLSNIDANEFDLIILSGGSDFPLERKDIYQAEIDLILSSEVPVIGICLGAELIAKLFGSEITELEEKQRTVIEINPTNSSLAAEIFADVPNLKVKESHEFTIPEVFSPLQTLATSDTGVEIFYHKTLPIFGLQFHPESSVAGIGGRQIFLNIVKSSLQA